MNMPHPHHFNRQNLKLHSTHVSNVALHNFCLLCVRPLYRVLCCMLHLSSVCVCVSITHTRICCTIRVFTSCFPEYAADLIHTQTNCLNISPQMASSFKQRVSWHATAHRPVSTEHNQLVRCLSIRVVCVMRN